MKIPFVSFEKMHDDIKGSIVIISHQERILNIADEIVLVKDGKIEKYGNRNEILPQIFSKVKPCHKVSKNVSCSKKS